MICIPIKKKSWNGIFKSLEEASKLSDVIEVWFDELGDLNEAKIQKLFKLKTTPLIYKSQGKTKNLELILKYMPEYIDLDLKIPTKIIKLVKKLSSKTKIILSYHNFKKTPSIRELKKISVLMKRKGADIIKIATYAEKFENSITMLTFLRMLLEEGNKAICLCMGKEGRLTRWASHLLGNYLMYAPLKNSDKTADGQMPAAELRIIQNLTK